MRKGFWERGKGHERFWPACDYPRTQNAFVEAGAVRFWVETEGKGTPLVLIHGGPGGSHWYFHPNMSVLVNESLLIYYDLRGHYMSSEPATEDEYGLVYDTQDLESLRIAAGLGAIDVLGHSYGAIVALMYGLTYPENLRRMVFCSAPADITDDEADQLLAARRLSIELDESEAEDVRKELYYRLYFHKPLGPESLHYNELSRKSFSSLKSQRVTSCYQKKKTELN